MKTAHLLRCLLAPPCGVCDIRLSRSSSAPRDSFATVALCAQSGALVSSVQMLARDRKQVRLKLLNPGGVMKVWPCLQSRQIGQEEANGSE